MGVKLGYKQNQEHVRKRMASKMATLATRPKPFGKDWLEARYTIDQLDCVQIGNIAKRDPKTIWTWLKYYGIQTRPRGSNHVHLPKDGSAFKGRKHNQKTKDLIRAAAIADQRVPFDRSIGPPFKGKHGADTPNWKGGITPERQSFYSSEAWKEACVEVWQRADARCERCGLDHRSIDRSEVEFHVHHIVSFKVRELRAESGNLALLCDKCHRFVHSRRNVNQEWIKSCQ